MGASDVTTRTRAVADGETAADDEPAVARAADDELTPVDSLRAPIAAPARRRPSEWRPVERAAGSAVDPVGAPLPAPDAGGSDPSATAPSAEGRAGRTARRIIALAMILILPATVLALVTTAAPKRELPRADASYISTQLIRADQRVRTQLSRLRDNGTTGALAVTRDAALTTRSLAVGLRSFAGAEDLRRALRLEAAWLDAVGSTLANPRSPLRARLRARDAAARAALDALPAPRGSRRGGASHLVDYARSRERAAAGERKP